MQYLRTLLAIASFPLVLACSGNLGFGEDDPLKPDAYSWNGIVLHLHGNGAAVLCDNGRLARKSGAWRQAGTRLELDFDTVTTYGSKDKADSVSTVADSTEVWEIRVSEFGFHHRFPLGDGSFEDHSYLREGEPLGTSCTFR
jgi:hypothetical protein